MANFNFPQDLNEIGIQGEKHVTLFLIENNAKLIEENNNKTHDMKMLMPNGVEVLLEVKTDVRCRPGNDTGNMFIEFECRGKESGIQVTESDYFVYYYPFLKQMWFIKTENLKEIINNNEFRIATEAGDKGSFTKGYLLGREWFRKSFKVKDTDFEWIGKTEFNNG